MQEGKMKKTVDLSSYASVAVTDRDLCPNCRAVAGIHMGE